jgi:hypothetical protein
MALAIINDYVVSRRMKLFLDEDDFAILNDNWETENELLVDLQHTQAFSGKTRWCDLAPFHYKFMIATNIAKAFQQIKDDEVIEANAVVRSLNFLICGLIRCIEERAECHIEMIRFARVGSMDVAVEFEAALAMEESIKGGPVEVEKQPGLSVVVDNSNCKD